MREEQFDDARLILGDCLEVIPTLSPVSHVITDPPFEARMHALHAAFKLRRTDGGPQRRDLTFDSIANVREPFLDKIKLLNQGWLLAFCNVEGVGEWQAAILARDMKFKTTCIWNKPDSTPKLNGQGPALSYECFVTAWCGPGYARWNGGGRRGVFTHSTNPTTRHGLHPTEKPLTLMAEIVSLFTNPDETILDPFAGTASCGVAALTLGRKYIGIEQNPVYFEAACERLERASKQPRLFREPPMKQVKMEF